MARRNAVLATIVFVIVIALAMIACGGDGELCLCRTVCKNPDGTTFETGGSSEACESCPGGTEFVKTYTVCVPLPTNTP